MKNASEIRKNVYRLMQDGKEIISIEAHHAEQAIDRLVDMGYDIFHNSELELEIIKHNYIADEWDNWHPQFF